MTSFFRFVNKRTIYWLGIISLARVHVTDYPVVNVHVDELLSAQIWQQKLCATLSANVNINYRLPIKVYYRICTLRHIRIEIIHGSQNVFWVLTWVGVYPVIIVYTVYTGFWFIQCSVYTGFWFIQCSLYTGFWFIQCSVYTGFWFIQCSLYTGFWFIQCSVYTGFWFIQCSVYTGFWFIQCSV
jgi:hypothetical protein